MGRQVKFGVRIHQHSPARLHLRRFEAGVIHIGTGYWPPSGHCLREHWASYLRQESFWMFHRPQKNDFDVGTHWRFVSAAQFGTYGCKKEATGCNTGENCET